MLIVLLVAAAAALVLPLGAAFSRLWAALPRRNDDFDPTRHD